MKKSLQVLIFRVWHIKNRSNFKRIGQESYKAPQTRKHAVPPQTKQRINTLRSRTGSYDATATEASEIYNR